MMTACRNFRLSIPSAKHTVLDGLTEIKCCARTAIGYVGRIIENITEILAKDIEKKYGGGF